MARRNRDNVRRNRRPEPETWAEEGVVEAISTKQWGRKTLYNARVNDEWYGFGEKGEDLQKGDVVALQVYENDKGYLTVHDYEILEEGSGAPDAEPPARGRGRGGRSSKREESSGRAQAVREERETKQNDKQQSIVYQNARTTAQTTLHFLLEQGVVTIGTKTAKPAQKEAAYYGLLDQLTAMYYEETQTLAALSRAADALSGGSDDPADAGDPDEVYDD